MLNFINNCHVLAKPRGPICNLACDYCYYLPKKRLFQNTEFKMSDEILENFIIQKIITSSGKEVEFTWQGGEPTLLGLQFFKKVVNLQRKSAPKSMKIYNSIQTNGLLITPDWCRFFKAHNFLIGISIDGPKMFHDIFRHFKDGQGSYEAVIKAIKLFKQYNVDFNILCCVHEGNVDHPLEVYRFLRDEIGARFIQFIPIVQGESYLRTGKTQQSSTYSVEGTDYGGFLRDIFEDWVHHDVGKVFVQIFDVALEIYAGFPSSLCVFAETCGKALVLEHNGDLYSCDHFVDMDHWLGNISESPLIDLVKSERQISFGMQKKDHLSKFCLTCDVRFLCNGGCPKNRDPSGLNKLCESYQLFFRHIDRPMRLMVSLLRQHRAPAEIMSIL